MCHVSHLTHHFYLLNSNLSGSILSRPEQSESRIEGCGLASNRAIAPFDARSPVFRATQDATL
jgi:hypothetical protein